jgi:radical SAM superfamily enzyme YgiQ (UPF0313 family)
MDKIKNILLINPLENLTKQCESYPSGALILLGTMAQNLGYNIKIVHMGADKVGSAKLKNIILTLKPDIVGITMNTFQTKSTKEITKIIKEVNKNILVVIGGPHPSALTLRIFDYFPDVDVVIVGEGEHTFLEIIEGKDLEKIKGICYKDKMNKIQINEPRPIAENLDYIPLPNLDLVDFNENKFSGVEPIGALPSMYIMASRGCPFQCIYCNKSIWGCRTRFRKPELIIEEIKWLHDKYGVREIFFQDDTFNLNKKWAKRIFNLIIDNSLNKDIIYKTPFRANEQLVDKELLELAKRAGFRYIFYGVESGNQGILNGMKKALTVREIKRAFELTHSVGLKTIASFIIGLPGETKKTIRDTINLWKELNPYIAGCSFATPLPATELERILIEKGHLLDNNYDHYGLGVCVVRTDELSKENLEYYGMKIKNKIDIMDIKRKLSHITTNREYFKKKITTIFKNPRSIMRRFRYLVMNK